MLIITDYQGRGIRLPDERLDKIHVSHPEMRGLEWTIPVTLEAPEVVRRSRDDPQTVRLYYRWFTGLVNVGDKYVCVIVKLLDEDAFAMTAYAPNRIKEGEDVL